MQLVGRETRKCPPEFQARITRMFGVNQFGQPNYKFAWGQCTYQRRGYLWEDKFGNEHVGYRDKLMSSGNPCWMLMKWKPAAFYGSPAYFYLQTRDEQTGLCHMGEYPWKGRYEVLYELRDVSMNPVTRELEISNFPLSHILIDAILPMLRMAQMMTPIEREAAAKLAKDAEDAALTKQIADDLEARRPAWFGPVSFSQQGCKTSLLDNMMGKIERQWKLFAKMGKRRFLKGFQQGTPGNRPMAVKS